MRQALTYAINRQEYRDGFLRGYGELGVTDVVPLCYWAKHPELKPYPYDVEKAKSLLAEEGWKRGSDGILEKNGRKFSFKLSINKGNKGREFLAVLIQKNLKEVGIDCQIETMESNVMTEKMRNRELDAFIAGFVVAPPDVDPSEIRLSDLERTPYNLTGFQNKRVDELINLAKAELQILNTAKYWKEYQEIIYDEQPETIVTWGSPLVGVSKRVKKAVITPVANFDRIWEWEMETSSVAEKSRASRVQSKIKGGQEPAFCCLTKCRENSIPLEPQPQLEVQAKRGRGKKPVTVAKEHISCINTNKQVPQDEKFRNTIVENISCRVEQATQANRQSCIVR